MSDATAMRPRASGEMTAREPLPNYASPFSAADVEELLPVMAEVLRSGHLALGSHVAAFERELAALTSSDYAVSTSSGTTALITAMRALSGTTWLDGGEVLVPAHTFFAVPAAVLLAGGRVRLVDISLDAIAPTLEQFISRRNPSTVGAVLVHMGGIMSPETDAIATWFRGQGLWVLEDATHALGSRLDGRHAGTFADAGASMFATKVLKYDEGGVVVTDRTDVAERARLLTNLGRRDGWGHVHEVVGPNGRLAELNAALGRQLLGRSAAIFAHRQRLAEAYDAALAEQVDVGLEVIRPCHESAHYKYIVLLPPEVDRATVRNRLGDQGVQLTREIYSTALYEQPALRGHIDADERYPVTEDFTRRHVCLPLHGAMSPADASWAAARLVETVGALRSAAAP